MKDYVSRIPIKAAKIKDVIIIDTFEGDPYLEIEFVDKGMKPIYFSRDWQNQHNPKRGDYLIQDLNNEYCVGKEKEFEKLFKLKEG